MADSTLNISTADFDKKVSNPGFADIPVVMTLEGNTLTKIADAAADLVLNVDYTMAGNDVAIKREYLNKAAAGAEIVLTFTFSAGASPTVTVTIKDNSTLSIVNAIFDRKSDAVGHAAIVVTLTLAGNTLASISDEDGALVEDTDYTVVDGVVTIAPTYFDKYARDVDIVLKFVFSAGADVNLPVTVGRVALQTTLATGHRIHIANDLAEEEAAELEQCPNCNNAIKTIKAGNVDHCHYCGYVFRLNN